MFADGNLSTLILLGVIVTVSLVGFSNKEFMEKYLFYPYRVKHYGEYYRFMSHGFLHLDVLHLLFNSIVLYQFGSLLERFFIEKHEQQIGEAVYWAFILAAMFVSCIISFLRNKDNPHYKSLGFSGVTSAMVFAIILLAPDLEMGLIFLPIRVPAWLFGAVYLGFEIYADRQKKSNIAHDAHIAGAVFGIIFIFLTNIDFVVDNFRSLFG